MSVGVFVGVHEHVVSGVSGVRVAAALQRSPLALFRLPFAAVGALVWHRCYLLLCMAISRELLLKAVRLRLHP